MYRRLLVALLAGLTFLTAPLARAVVHIDFQFVSDPDPSGSARILFDGTNQTISFPDANDGFDFIIAAASDASLIGLKGKIDGTFNASSISSNSATLAGFGTFSITDLALNVLTATLAFDSIQRLGTSFVLNPDALPNLQKVTYGGTNAALQNFRDGLGQSVTLSGAFNPGKSLVQLLNQGGVNTTTYAGAAVSEVPEPSTLALMTCGILALVGWSNLRRST